MKFLIHLFLLTTLACGTLMSQDNPRLNKATEDAKKEGGNNKKGNAKKKTEREREQAKKQREHERKMAENKGGANANSNANRNQPNKKDQPAKNQAEQPKKTPENPRMAVNKSNNNQGGQKNTAQPQPRANKQSPQAREQANRLAEANARQREKRRELSRKMNQDTVRYLQDRGRANGNWEEQQRRYREHSHNLKDKDDAGNLILTILGSAAAGAVVGNIVSKDRTPHRLPYDQVGRTDVERRDSVDYMVHRFRGEGGYRQAPPGYDSGGRYGYNEYGQQYQPHYYDGNRRVVYYNSRDEIPPVLMAYNRLDRVHVSPYDQSPYRYDSGYYHDIPDTYRSRDAYALSYSVDPNTVMSRDDILFQQGSTDFADAYSYDIVVDLAEAMRSSELSNTQFIIEGHASAEGDYSSNLRLSQLRAERIARDLVDMGVDPNRLIPVGYGEAESQYPADAAENFRALDRRVMVFAAGR